ncbi:MAG TPA: hypothetical protein VEV19_04910 [Ktedonobacteraceae bacterium]|nr:hypothetical protein [Ktedonobacteraceae bacterium]
MADQADNQQKQTQADTSKQAQTGSSHNHPTPQQVEQQNRQNINQTGDLGQQQFGDQGVQEGYSYKGPHGISSERAENAPDGYGNQDQFGDVDGQDPYNNLYQKPPVRTPKGDGLSNIDETLYGLAKPLAKPGDKSRQGSDKDAAGTRMSQDQQGYQQ